MTPARDSVHIALSSFALFLAAESLSLPETLYTLSKGLGPVLLTVVWFKAARGAATGAWLGFIGSIGCRVYRAYRVYCRVYRVYRVWRFRVSSSEFEV